MTKIDRRRFLKASTAVTAIHIVSLASATGQALVSVKLLVLRKPGLSLTNHCVAPCIRGRIYDVSDLDNFKLDQLILPAVKARPPLCDTIERPFLNNHPYVSSIQRGIYPAKVRDDKTKPWMDVIDKRWRIELEGVPHRSAIQFHYGSDVGWSAGCFIVGKASISDNNLRTSYCSLTNSDKAIASLRAAVTAPGRNQNDILIAVADDMGLFPNVQDRAGC